MKIACHAIVALLWLLHTSSFRYSTKFPAHSQKSRAGQLACQRIVPARRKRYDDNDIDFGPLLKKCKRDNDFQPAIELAEKALQLRPMPPSILTGVIKVFGEAGQLGRAVSLLKVMREEMNVVPNEYHLGALIAACRRCGQWEMGVALYNRMDSLQVKKNTVICNNIISTLGDALQWGSVFEILIEMDTLNIKKDIVTYSSSITACVKAGEWERATTLYRMMEKEGIMPNTITLNAALNACARGRQVRLALDLFSEACKTGIQVDAISYSVVIKVCGDINEFNVALALFNAMGEENSPDDHKSVNSRQFALETWNSSSSSQFSGEYVKEIINSCKRVPRDTGCYNSMITCCERAGKWEMAVDILNCMMKAGRSMARPDCKTFSAAISCCGKQGHWKEACAIFDLMTVEGVKKDTAVYNAVIAALQLAAQRQATEELKSRSGSVITDTGKGKALSSADLLEKAQIIYAEGLKDGQLQHFAYDSLEAPLDRGHKKSHSTPTNVLSEALILTALDSDGNSQLKSASPSLSSSPMVVMGATGGTGASRDSAVVSFNLSESVHSVRALDINKSDGLALPTLQEVTPDNSTLSSSSSSSSSSSNSNSDSSSSSSMSSSSGPRILDLHKCPLLIAEAAIDYEMKQIYDECVAQDPIVGAYGNDRSTTMSSDMRPQHASSSSSRSNRDEGDLVVQRTEDLFSSRRSSRHNRKKMPGVVPSNRPAPPPQSPDIPAAVMTEAVEVKTCAFDLHIITGRGNHINSSGTRGVLRLNIKDYLLDTYDIVAERIVGNDGCIIVTSSSINRWIGRMQSLSEKSL